jgi:hypothetical protein
MLRCFLLQAFLDLYLIQIHVRLGEPQGQSLPDVQIVL